MASPPHCLNLTAGDRRNTESMAEGAPSRPRLQRDADAVAWRLCRLAQRLAAEVPNRRRVGLGRPNATLLWTRIQARRIMEIFVALVGLSAIFVADTPSNKKRRVMQHTLDEMRIDRRACVTADINLSGDITYDPMKNIINIPLFFQIRNIGKTPAIYLDPNFKLFPASTDITPAIIKLCKLE
jgi:hypothetical protein